MTVVSGRVEALTSLPLPEAAAGKVDVLVSEWMGETQGWSGAEGAPAALLCCAVLPCLLDWERSNHHGSALPCGPLLSVCRLRPAV